MASEKNIMAELEKRKRQGALCVPSDPTLTVENVTEVVECISVDGRIKLLSEPDLIATEQQKEINQKFFTNDQSVHACVDYYVNHPIVHPSWTTLCRKLYRMNEVTAARKAKAFIPLSDPTLTVGNVIGVMEKVTDGPGKATEVWRRLMNEDLLEDINSKCSTEKELLHTCADIYVNCNPDGSWELIATQLYRADQTAAVEAVRSYLSPRDLTLTTKRLMELFASMDDEKVDSMGDSLDTPSSESAKFQMNYQNPTQKKEAYLDYYIYNHPAPSWGTVAVALTSGGLYQQANMVQNTYIHVSERTRLNFEAAMKDGMLLIRNGSTFFLGPGGSGKTHTLYALLEEDPPVIRESTACAKKPIRAVAQFKVGVSGTTHFIRITDDQYSEMLANSAEYSSVIPKYMVAKPVAIVQAHESHSLEETKPVAKSIDIESYRPVTKLRKELLGRMQAKSKTSDQLHDKDLVDVKDSGGQPMFHEVLPAFVTNTMFGILTVKLNESLDSQPLVEYYISGNRIGEPFKSLFTHLQTFRHCLRVLQSTCDQSTRPKIVFIGTHKDLEHECKHENRKEKEQKLRRIIPPEMKDSIIYNGESLLFAINAKNPGNEDRKLISNLRDLMIKELQKLPKVEIPLRYFSLENAFQRLAKYQRRAILSVDECLKEATAYHFTKDTLNDVLQYLHSLKLIMYYKDILPDVVFIDAQVLLDKITELVEYSIELRAKPSNQVVAAGSLEKFKTCGIVDVEILSQFSSGYVPCLFEEKELILLFKELLIVAEVGKGKYLMPSLLEEEKVQIHSCLNSVVPPLLFYFGENGPNLGIYCFLLASLITDAKWKLLTEDGTPVQLSRNRVRFSVPGNNPGCITITDSFSTFLHIDLEFPNEVTSEQALEICDDICPKIREIILTSVRKASHKLNYSDSLPEAAFLCSKHDSTVAPHPATISHSTGVLTCTTHPRSVFSELTDKHRLWFGNATASPSDGICASVPAAGGKLSINELRKVQKAAWEARAKWYNIGLELDIDPGTLDTIKGNNDNIDDRFRAMLTTWLKMVQLKPTWIALAEALRSPTVGYGDLANLCQTFSSSS